MDHVKPMLAQIICDSTRELGMIARPAMGISGIFIKKVTKLPNMFNGISHCRQFADLSGLCNFWTNEAKEDCDSSKWPELPQDFKFLINTNFFA